MLSFWLRFDSAQRAAHEAVQHDYNCTLSLRLLRCAELAEVSAVEVSKGATIILSPNQ